MIKHNLLSQHEWLEQKNIKYYVAIAPNKLSIYGEYLPVLQADNFTKFEQLQRSVQSLPINLIDLKSNFSDFKEKRLYHKLDSHWNELGGFAGYTTLLHTIQYDFPEILPLQLNDFVIDSVETYYGDITRMLMVRKHDYAIRLKFKIPQQASIKSDVGASANMATQEGGRVVTKNEHKPLKVLIFHDSFNWAWFRYINETFGECIFIHDNSFDEQMIEREQPDIVIREIVERNIERLMLNKKKSD